MPSTRGDRTLGINVDKVVESARCEVVKLSARTLPMVQSYKTARFPVLPYQQFLSPRNSGLANQHQLPMADYASFAPDSTLRLRDKVLEVYLVRDTHQWVFESRNPRRFDPDSDYHAEDSESYDGDSGDSDEDTSDKSTNAGTIAGYYDWLNDWKITATFYCTDLHPLMSATAPFWTVAHIVPDSGYICPSYRVRRLLRPPPHYEPRSCMTFSRVWEVQEFPDRPREESRWVGWIVVDASRLPTLSEFELGVLTERNVHGAYGLDGGGRTVFSYVRGDPEQDFNCFARDMQPRHGSWWFWPVAREGEPEVLGLVREGGPNSGEEGSNSDEESFGSDEDGPSCSGETEWEEGPSSDEEGPSNDEEGAEWELVQVGCPRWC